MASIKQKIDAGQLIRDRIFQGNIHAQGAYFREAIEVLMKQQKALISVLTPEQLAAFAEEFTTEQVLEIQKREGEFEYLNKSICDVVGKKTLEELVGIEE